jgi:hypothetical protein
VLKRRVNSEEELARIMFEGPNKEARWQQEISHGGEATGVSKKKEESESKEFQSEPVHLKGEEFSYRILEASRQNNSGSNLTNKRSKFSSPE